MPKKPILGFFSADSKKRGFCFAPCFEHASVQSVCGASLHRLRRLLTKGFSAACSARDNSRKPMRRSLVAGNWKMNGSRTQARQLVQTIVRDAPGLGSTEIVVCPPFILIPLVAEVLAKSNGVALGAQNVSSERIGAFTGEVSAAMLREHGCRYTIVGHSERRSLYAEDDHTIARKFAAAVEQELTPILCVGETLEEREAGQTETVVARQLDAVLGVSSIGAFAHAVIAYEPVWAIGTGRTATPQQAQTVHAFIRGKLAVLDDVVAANVRILYGGSVKGGNAQPLFHQTDIDGGLIGGASLDADEFLAICRAATR
jgi:triosephosphate isomerase (TIM)